MQAVTNQLKNASHPPKALQSKMETLILTPQMIADWKLPQCQRPKRSNCKTEMAREKIRQTETIEGVITLGVLKGSTALYIVDGQHRLEEFKKANIPEVIADVRIVTFGNTIEMAEEFVRLNSSLVPMRPDDLLRGSELSFPFLRKIRQECEFVGYGQVRRGGGSGPILSMSALLRCWRISECEVPSGGIGSSLKIAQELEQKSVSNLIAFLSVAYEAWGRDPEHYRLWGNLNMTLCMWLWNKLVIDRDRSGTKRYALLDIPTFKKCLMSVSASADYNSWLVGRNLSDRDRSPAYGRLKALFTSRLATDGGKAAMRLPQPAWASV
jgi:hypothetical protein